ncbi:armadillo-type protein [Mycena galopus ATCC 62051]|nr:armadillo-type protein [Mycena galopus ATCC 62051]
MSSPLARQETRASILSWWSDSNPGLQNPTINIHAAAKPLCRFLYHRQALDLISNNHGSPPQFWISTRRISRDWDYVSWATKATILSELARVARFSEVDAQAVVDSPVLANVPKMLESPHTRTRSVSCRLLGSLSQHASTALAILELKPCERLVFLLRDTEPKVVRAAAQALCDIAKSAHGAQAVVNAKALDQTLELLEFPDRSVIYRAWSLLDCLTSHLSTAPAILTLETCERLVFLFDEDSKVVLTATFALYQIAQWEDGAKAIVDAKALDHILTLLESPIRDVVRQACELIGTLACHNSTALVILELKPCARLVSLLQDEKSMINEGALYTLSQIARSADGAQAIVNAKAFDHLFKFVDSTNVEVRTSSRILLKCLASHESIAPTTEALSPTSPAQAAYNLCRRQLVNLVVSSIDGDVLGT